MRWLVSSSEDGVEQKRKDLRHRARSGYRAFHWDARADAPDRHPAVYSDR